MIHPAGFAFLPMLASPRCPSFCPLAFTSGLKVEGIKRETHLCTSFLTDVHTCDIWDAVFPFAPMKTMARAEEMLRGQKNTFCDLSSSPNIFNKRMAKEPFASQRSSIWDGLNQKHSTEAHQSSPSVVLWSSVSPLADIRYAS